MIDSDDHPAHQHPAAASLYADAAAFGLVVAERVAEWERLQVVDPGMFTMWRLGWPNPAATPTAKHSSLNFLLVAESGRRR